MMNWAFANFENVTLFSANDVIENAPVWLGHGQDHRSLGRRPRSDRHVAEVVAADGHVDPRQL